MLLCSQCHGRMGNGNPNYSMSLDELLEITHSAAITTARAVRWYLLLFHERIGDSLIPSVLDTCSDCLSIARSAGVDDKTNWYFGARFPIYSMRQKKEQKKDRRQQEQLVIKNGRPNSVDKEEIVNSNGVHHQATRLLSDTSDDWKREQGITVDRRGGGKKEWKGQGPRPSSSRGVEQLRRRCRRRGRRHGTIRGTFTQWIR